MIVIGVTGYKRTGKSTVCRLLVEHFGFTQYGFADPLRDMARAINPVISLEGAPAHVLDLLRHHAFHVNEWRYADLEHVLGYEVAKDIPDFRRFLQRLGTEGVRATFGPNAWVDALARRVAADGTTRVCISDVRFFSEAAWVQRQGGVIWRTHRPGIGGDDTHASENDVPRLPADLEFVANTIDELAESVFAATLAIARSRWPQLLTPARPT